MFTFLFLLSLVAPQTVSPCTETLTAPSTTPLDLTKIVPFAAVIPDRETILRHTLAYFDAADPAATPRFAFLIERAALTLAAGTTDCYTFEAPAPTTAGSYYAGMQHTSLESVSAWVFTSFPAIFEMPPPPPPPISVCVSDPLKVTVTKWPISATGSRSASWNTNGKTLVSIAFHWGPQRIHAEDIRGCKFERLR